MSENNIEPISLRTKLEVLKHDTRPQVIQIMAAADILKQYLFQSDSLSEKTEYYLNSILENAKLLEKMFGELQLD
jgi:hypothetical protein